MLAGIEHGYEMGATDRGGDPGLALETPSIGRVGSVLLAKDLDCNDLAIRPPNGSVDPAGSTLTQQRPQDVAIQRVRHTARLCRNGFRRIGPEWASTGV